MIINPRGSGKGWHKESLRHSKARLGIKTVLDNPNLIKDNFEKKDYTLAYVDGIIEPNEIVVISHKKHRASGQGENVKIIKTSNNKRYIYVKSLEYPNDRFWVKVKK